VKLLGLNDLSLLRVSVTCKFLDSMALSELSLHSVSYPLTPIAVAYTGLCESLYCHSLFRKDKNLLFSSILLEAERKINAKKSIKLCIKVFIVFFRFVKLSLQFLERFFCDEY
jgi:hypothetical protein